MRESYGVEGSGLARLVRAAYDLLELITFFTAGEDKEAVARPLRRGATALEAAGDKGLLRIEGRDYIVQDGDVITIKV